MELLFLLIGAAIGLPALAGFLVAIFDWFIALFGGGPA